ncbi:MAG: peptide-methionine (R)-S-oxide reductase MsrB [Candidatus Lokiarchaeota archaeon]|nr:peptide-methionine (R)-S-oxide reductase MsrB [Candidatus Lokiarchaeota archaeon]
MTENDTLQEEDWDKKLTKDQYQILRLKGTERPFTGKYWNNKEKGIYSCAGCGTPLFDSSSKFKSGSGWPSFFTPINDSEIKEESDIRFNMERTEVLCKKCGGHLGHVFKDGPKPTGLRYCINSISLDFKSNNTRTF